MPNHYSITTSAYRRYEVTDEYNRFVGQLDYPSWLSHKAQVIMKDGVRYEITIAGFWRRQMMITKEGMPFAEMRYTWRSKIEIVFNRGESLLFKRKSIWNSTYVILGSSDQEVATLQIGFDWRKLSFSYTVDVSENLLDKETNLLLPFLMLYCSKNVRARNAAVHG